jgi:ABC-type bacteriocin/lantibiotic exporter with double-glycine peptidase domain
MVITNSNPWKRLLKLLQLEKSDISALYFYAILSGLLSLSLPLGIQAVIRFIQSGQISTSWVVLVMLVVFGAVLTGVTQIMQLRITENIQQRIFVHYSFQFAHQFPRFDRKALGDSIPVELMNRFFDIISLQKGFSKVLLDFTSAFLQIVFSLLVLSFYHPFYIAFSILLILLLVVIFRPILRKGIDTSLQESKYKYATAFWLQEIARADWSFRINPTENLSLNQLDQNTTAYLKTRENHFKILWKQFVWMIAIKALIVASLLGLGGYLVISQQINLGQFVAAEVLILLLLAAVEKIIQSLETLYDVCTSLEKLEQVSDLPVSLEEKQITENTLELFPIELMNKKDKNHTPIIQIQKGENVLLIGNNQRETNNLLKMLIDPSVNPNFVPRWNHRLAEESKLQLGFERIGWFTRDDQIIAGNLVENVTLGRPGINQDQVAKILHFVGLEYLYKNRLEGLDLRISSYNNALSSEEKDRLLIARALIDHPELLIISFLGSSISWIDQKQILEKIHVHFPEMTVLAACKEDLVINWKKVEFNSLEL